MHSSNSSFDVMGACHRVLFQSPDIPQLCQAGTVVDLHFHSHYSDGANSPRKIAEKAERLGIGIAITDHNGIEGALALDRQSTILNIPGIEITSREGAHILLYFYTARSLRRFFEADVKPFLGKERMSSIALSMEDIIRKARPYEPVIIFPHPFSAMYTGICNPMFSQERQETLLSSADGVEVINSGNLKKWNLQSALLGFNLNKIMTGGSDGHSLYQMGKALTCASTPPDRTAFLDALKAGNTRVVGKEIDFIHKVASNGAKLPASVKNSGDLMGKNVRYGYALFNHKSRGVKTSMRRLFNHHLMKKSA
ncbi:MAG: PHP domain-containing protein [Thermodesulfobacteriota bacterium]